MNITHDITIALAVIGALTVAGGLLELSGKVARIVRRSRARSRLIARCEAMKRSPGWAAYWLGKGPRP